MNPVDRVTKFLALAGIDRPAEKRIQTDKGATVVLDSLKDDERIHGYRSAAERLFQRLDLAEQARDLTIASGKLALHRCIEVGEMLIEFRDLFSGDFDEWLENYCADRCDRSTAYRYMKAVRYKDALGDDAPDFASLKELYVAAGIMPPPDSTGQTRAPAPLFRLKFECHAGNDPEGWDPVVRREFIAKAKPIAELLERAIAAEAS